MWKKIKALLALNKSDLLIALGLTAAPWLIIHLITSGVMLIVRPYESIFVSGMLLPLSVGIAAFTVTAGNAQMTFSQAVRFSCSRKRALPMVLAMAGLMSFLSMAVGSLLLALERTCSMPVWRVLSGNTGLLVDDFGFVWWGIPLGTVIGFALGLIYAVLLLRFGNKGVTAWMILWFGGMAAFQALPWRTHEVTNVLIPVLAVLLVLSVVWSVRSMLKLSIPK